MLYSWAGDGAGLVLELVFYSLQGATQPSSMCRMNIHNPTRSKLKKVPCSSVWFYFLGINCTAFLFMPYLSNERGSSWCLGQCCFSMGDSKAQEDQPIPLIYKTSCFLKLLVLGRLIASDILIAFLTTDILSEERICFGLDWGVQEGHQNC